MNPRFAGAVIILALAAPAAAHADKRACLDAHGEAQKLRKSGHLTHAREKLLTCATPACPALVERDCARWLEEVDAEQPTVVLSARDSAGNETARARVRVDGRPLAYALDGRPVPVDPGDRTFRFELAGGEVREITLLVRAYEKGREVRVELAPSAPQRPSAPPASPARAASAERARAVPIAAWVAGGAGLAALGSWAYFGIAGNALRSRLLGSCAPNCAQSDVDAVKRDYLAADVSLAVAAIAIGAATVVLWTASGSSRDKAPASTVTLGAWPGGATLRGAF